MNEKFFDLKKEKQDRMINAALKVFAKNGYRHASTDEIVAEAGISKGLLFHYFGSKMGLYSFLYDYSVRYMILELKSCVSDSEKDYFAIMKSVETAKLASLNNYPYMQAFIDKSQTEEDEEAIDETYDMRAELQEVYDAILNQVDASAFRAGVDPAALDSILSYALRGIMNEQLQTTSFNAVAYHAEAVKYIEMLKIMAY